MTARTLVRAVLLAALLTVTGCMATKNVNWTHPEKADSTYVDVKRECKKEARERAENMGVAGNPFAIADYTKQCLRQRGWEAEEAEDGG